MDDDKDDPIEDDIDAEGGGGEPGKFAKGNTIGSLTRFAPGVSGNPAGRPKDVGKLGAIHRRMLSEPLPYNIANLARFKGCRTYAEALVRATLLNALAGKPRALQEAWDRCDGRVPLPIMEKLELSGPDGEPISFTLAIGNRGGNGNGNGGGG